MRKDLEAARLVWIQEASNEDERQAREDSDFLLYINHAGRFADFHANRHTYITNLSKAGVALKTAQTLARHSDPRLTMNIYTHSNVQDQAEAVAKLPKLWEYVRSKRESQDGINGHSVPVDGETEETPATPADSTQVEEESRVVATCQPLSRRMRSTPDRIRTYNLRIRSPVLYPVELQVLVVNAFSLSNSVEMTQDVQSQQSRHSRQPVVSAFVSDEPYKEICIFLRRSGPWREKIDGMRSLFVCDRSKWQRRRAKDTENARQVQNHPATQASSRRFAASTG